MISIFKKDIPLSEYEIISFRCNGDKKLSKPTILKGISKFATIPYIHKKSNYQAFRKDNDIYVKFTDYFSPSMVVEENGMPLEAKVKKYMGKYRATKFTYGDSWGDIVLRQEAWSVFKNLITDIDNNNIHKLDMYNHVVGVMEKYHDFSEGDLECTNMSRSLETLVDECYRIIDDRD